MLKNRISLLVFMNYPSNLGCPQIVNKPLALKVHATVKFCFKVILIDLSLSECNFN